MPKNVHALNVYSQAASYEDNVLEFLLPRLRAGHGVLVVVPNQHRKIIQEALHGFRFQRDQVQYVGTRPLIDAIFSNGQLVPRRFTAILESFVAQARRGGGGEVCAVGEIVDVLWQSGRLEDALAVEAVWDDFLQKTPVDLLCSYRAAEGPGEPPVPLRVLGAHDPIPPKVLERIVDGRDQWASTTQSHRRVSSDG